MKIEINAYDPLCPEGTPFTGGFKITLSLNENNKDLDVYTDLDLFTIDLGELFEAVNKFKEYAGGAEEEKEEESEYIRTPFDEGWNDLKAKTDFNKD